MKGTLFPEIYENLQVISVPTWPPAAGLCARVLWMHGWRPPHLRWRRRNHAEMACGTRKERILPQKIGNSPGKSRISLFIEKSWDSTNKSRDSTHKGCIFDQHKFWIHSILLYISIIQLNMIQWCNTWAWDTANSNCHGEIDGMNRWGPWGTSIRQYEKNIELNIWKKKTCCWGTQFSTRIWPRDEGKRDRGKPLFDGPATGKSIGVTWCVACVSPSLAHRSRRMPCFFVVYPCVCLLPFCLLYYWFFVIMYSH